MSLCSAKELIREAFSLRRRKRGLEQRTKNLICNMQCNGIGESRTVFSPQCAPKFLMVRRIVDSYRGRLCRILEGRRKAARQIHLLLAMFACNISCEWSDSSAPTIDEQVCRSPGNCCLDHNHVGQLHWEIHSNTGSCLLANRPIRPLRPFLDTGYSDTTLMPDIEFLSDAAMR